MVLYAKVFGDDKKFRLKVVTMKVFRIKKDPRDAFESDPQTHILLKNVYDSNDFVDLLVWRSESTCGTCVVTSDCLAKS